MKELQQKYNASKSVSLTTNKKVITNKDFKNYSNDGFALIFNNDICHFQGWNFGCNHCACLQTLTNYFSV